MDAYVGLMLRFAVPTLANAGFKLFGAAAMEMVSWSPILPLGPFLAATAVVGAAVAAGAAGVAGAAFATVVGAAVVGEVFVAGFFGVVFFEAAVAEAEVTARLTAKRPRATLERRVESLDMGVLLGLLSMLMGGW
jgi:hypothetical protein